MMLTFVGALEGENHTKPHKSPSNYNTKPHFPGRTAKNGSRAVQVVRKDNGL